MCGRYTLATPASALKDTFGLTEVSGELRPRFNIAPGQEVAVVPNDGERSLRLFRWGLIPSWAKDPAIGNRMINARAETLAEKPSFRNALRRRRCLIAADGFYEWKKEGTQKIPYYIRLRSREPFAFAGLWESWHPTGGDPIHSCTIVTTEPNELLAGIHNRMPVILPAAHYGEWLDPSPRDAPAFRELLAPYPEAEMEAYAVSRLVNSPANDRPECIGPA